MDHELDQFCCQNPRCPDYGRRATGKLSVCHRYGPSRRRLLYCRTCKARFSERKGTPLFKARLPVAQAVSVLAHVVEGCGVRRTSRLVGVNKNTVLRYSVLAGRHSRALHDELVAFSPDDTGGSVR